MCAEYFIWISSLCGISFLWLANKFRLQTHFLTLHLFLLFFCYEAIFAGENFTHPLLRGNWHTKWSTKGETNEYASGYKCLCWPCFLSQRSLWLQYMYVHMNACLTTCMCARNVSAFSFLPRPCFTLFKAWKLYM